MSEIPKSHPKQQRRMFELDGEVLCLRHWAKRGGMSDMTLRARLNRGMSLRDALALPVDQSLKANAARGTARRWGKDLPPPSLNTEKILGRSPTKVAYHAMHDRCRNPNHKAYAYYGAKEVTICERWYHYAFFLEDMGIRPAGATLDRIDNTKGYFKENCRWATMAEQNRNKPNNRNVTHNGKTQCIAQWAAEAGLAPRTLSSRLDNGWDFERAITEPSRGAAKANDRAAQAASHDTGGK